jgi:hypothetical protein
MVHSSEKSGETFLTHYSHSNFSQNSDLTPLQAQMDGLASTFIDKTMDLCSLAGVFVGGGGNRLVGGGIFSTVRPLMGLSPKLFLPFTQVMAGGAGFIAEASLFSATPRVLEAISRNGDLSILHLHGAGGMINGAFHSAVGLAGFKWAGMISPRQNWVVQGLLQSSVMMVSHRASALWGIADSSKDGLGQEWIEAQAMVLHLWGGMSLLHGLAPGLAQWESMKLLSIQAKEIGNKNIEGFGRLFNHQPAGISKKITEVSDTNFSIINSVIDKGSSSQDPSQELKTVGGRVDRATSPSPRSEVIIQAEGLDEIPQAIQQAATLDRSVVPVIQHEGLDVNERWARTFLEKEIPPDPSGPVFTPKRPLTIISHRQPEPTRRVTAKLQVFWQDGKVQSRTESSIEIIQDPTSIPAVRPEPVPRESIKEDIIDLSQPNTFYAITENSSRVKNLIGTAFMRKMVDPNLENITIRYLGDAWLPEETDSIKSRLQRQESYPYMNKKPVFILVMPYVNNLEFRTIGQQVVFYWKKEKGVDKLEVKIRELTRISETVPAHSNGAHPEANSNGQSAPVDIVPPMPLPSRRAVRSGTNLGHPAVTTTQSYAPLRRSSAPSLQPAVFSNELSSSVPIATVVRDSHLIPTAISLAKVANGKEFGLLHSGDPEFLRNDNSKTLEELAVALQPELVNEQKCLLIAVSSSSRRAFEFTKVEDRIHWSERSLKFPKTTHSAKTWAPLFEHLIQFLKPLPEGLSVRDPIEIYQGELENFDTHHFTRMLAEILNHHPMFEGQVITFKLENLSGVITLHRSADQVKVNVKIPNQEEKNLLLVPNPARGGRISLHNSITTETYPYQDLSKYQRELFDLVSPILGEKVLSQIRLLTSPEGRGQLLAEAAKSASPSQIVELHRFIHRAYTYLDFETIEVYRASLSEEVEEKINKALRLASQDGKMEKMLLPLERLAADLPGSYVMPRHSDRLRDIILRKIFPDSPLRPPQANFILLRDPDRLAKIFTEMFIDHLGFLSPTVRTQIAEEILKDLPEYRRILMEGEGDFHAQFVRAVFSGENFRKIYVETQKTTVKLQGRLNVEPLPTIEEIEGRTSSTLSSSPLEGEGKPLIR